MKKENCEFPFHVKNKRRNNNHGLNGLLTRKGMSSSEISFIDKKIKSFQIDNLKRYLTFCSVRNYYYNFSNVKIDSSYFRGIEVGKKASSNFKEMKKKKSKKKQNHKNPVKGF